MAGIPGDVDVSKLAEENANKKAPLQTEEEYVRQARMDLAEKRYEELKGNPNEIVYGEPGYGVSAKKIADFLLEILKRNKESNKLPPCVRGHDELREPRDPDLSSITSEILDRAISNDEFKLSELYDLETDGGPLEQELDDLETDGGPLEQDWKTKAEKTLARVDNILTNGENSVNNLTGDLLPPENAEEVEVVSTYLKNVEQKDNEKPVLDLTHLIIE